MTVSSPKSVQNLSPLRVAHYGQTDAERIQYGRRLILNPPPGVDPYWEKTYIFDDDSPFPTATNFKTRSEDFHDHDLDRDLFGALLDTFEEYTQLGRWDTCCVDGFGHVGWCEDECGAEPVYYPRSCELRICPKCARRDAAEFIELVYPQIIDMMNRRAAGEIKQSYRLREIVVTSSLPVLGVSLEEARENVKIFSRWVTKLIKKLELNKNGAGAYRAIEVGETGFKLHAHIIAWSKFIPQKDLVKAWNKVSGMQVCWIKSAEKVQHGKRIKDALLEALKYTVKVSRSIDGNDATTPREAAARYDLALEEVYFRVHQVLRGVRRVQGYGCFYGIEKREIRRKCPDCGASLVLEPESEFCARMNAPTYHEWTRLKFIGANKSPPTPPPMTQMRLI